MPINDEACLSTLRNRRSARKYLPEQIPGRELRQVLEDARTAPSNSNTQPWIVHIASGAARDKLSDRLVTAFETGHRSPDFSVGYGEGVHAQRAREFGTAYYGARGVERSDEEGRRRVLLENLRFFGAPHVALLFMPLIGDGVRAASDVGMYAQNFLLSLAARGYSGVPQTMIGTYADAVRDELGIDPAHRMLFAISFGIPDDDSALRSIPRTHLRLEDHVVLHDTDLS
jgi:nitroreductase